MEMGAFSQPSDDYKRNSKVDLAATLRESISFGRFFSESLDWEKWSTFNHNKHLEEAKNCSVPGSVAQKKALFEAHYRKSAALKLAAQLKPINDSTNLGFSFIETENVEPELHESACKKAEGEEQKNQRCSKASYKFGENHRLEKIDDNNSGPTMGIGCHEKHSLQINPSNRVENNENKAIAYDNDCMKQDKKAMKVVSCLSHQNENPNKNISATNIIKSNDVQEEQRISSSCASKIHKSLSKENKPTESHMAVCLRSNDRREKALGSPHMKVVDLNVACTSSRSSQFYHSHIKTPSKAYKTEPKHTFLTTQLECRGTQTPSYKPSSTRRKAHAIFCPLSIRTQTPLYKTSSTRRKAHAIFCPLSISCFKSSSFK
ncbi:uncharacterized protein LOC110037344 [Phalaenopsis equestris]|uniref:uncharacterized protein LOC110037344 n=1 Tax=Phalaenopsis equestris TaxID=78828 RepID=UPI0009E63B04|nr:uncharacterized protein LOC110037344 [Phalaenopsis equestris]